MTTSLNLPIPSTDDAAELRRVMALWQQQLTRMGNVVGRLESSMASRRTYLDDIKALDLSVGNATQQIQSAIKQVDAVASTVEGLANDDILTALEKPSMVTLVNAMLAEKDALETTSNELNIETEWNAYSTAVVQACAYLSEFLPAWDDTSVDTPLGSGGGVLLTKAFTAVDNAEAALRNRIAAIAEMSSYYVSGLVSYMTDQQTWIQWNPLDVTGIVYEVRLGGTWDTGQIMGKVLLNKLQVISDGTYWVCPRLGNSYGVPRSVIVSGSDLRNTNIVQAWNEVATGWPGTLSGGAVRAAGGGLTLQVVNGVVPVLTGRYETPALHNVDVVFSQLCGVYVALSVSASQISTTIDGFPDWDAIPSFDGSAGAYCRTEIEICTAGDDGTWGDWKAYVPGMYPGRIFKMALTIATTDPSVVPNVDVFSWTIDMPDRSESKSGRQVPAGGATITFTKQFQITPATHITIQNAALGDFYVLSNESATGFTVRLYDKSNNPVAGIINWSSTGY